MDAGTKVCLGAAIRSEGIIKRHIGVEPHDAKAIVHGTDSKNLAVIEYLHVVDVVDTCGDGEQLLAVIVE